MVTIKAVREKDELMMITANGIIIRTGLEDIRSIGRNTQGVRLVSLKDNDFVASIARVMIKEDDESDANIEGE